MHHILGFFRMDFYQLVCILGVVLTLSVGNIRSQIVSFYANYDVAWGNNHVSVLDQGREVRLTMDTQSGAGFYSKLNDGSGFFHLKMKLPDKDTSGVVTAFYLSSEGKYHDEVDFEFLGNKEGKPITLQTNVFLNGQGNREQRTLLWFNPSIDFHSYKILWNPYQIVLYVEDILIRVFKNNTKAGVMYPTQAMRIQASLWDGDSWATNGGRTKTNWSSAPFFAHFQHFNVDGCPVKSQSRVVGCNESGHWWNWKKYWTLNPGEEASFQRVRKEYMNYDYCTDSKRFLNLHQNVHSTFEKNLLV